MGIYGMLAGGRDIQTMEYKNMEPRLSSNEATQKVLSSTSYQQPQILNSNYQGGIQNNYIQQQNYSHQSSATYQPVSYN